MSFEHSLNPLLTYFRKEALAKQHHRQHVLCKHFQAWQIFARTEQLAKAVDQSKSRTKSKMAAFLQATSTRIYGDEEDEEDGESKVVSDIKETYYTSS